VGFIKELYGRKLRGSKLRVSNLNQTTMSFLLFFFPLIFGNDGSLTTNDKEIIIVFVQNLILSKKIFLFILLVFFCGKEIHVF